MADPGAAAPNAREPPVPCWDGLEPATTFSIYEKNVKLWEFESDVPEQNRGARLS